MAKSKTSMQMMAEAVAPTKDKTVAAAPAKTSAEQQVANAAGAVKEVVDAKADAKKEKAEKGPVKIETNQQLLKAIWSSRGLVFMTTPDFPVPIAIVKSTMTVYLKDTAVPGDPAPYDLVPRADNSGSDLVPMKKQ